MISSYFNILTAINICKRENVFIQDKGDRENIKV